MKRFICILMLAVGVLAAASTVYAHSDEHHETCESGHTADHSLTVQPVTNPTLSKAGTVKVECGVCHELYTETVPCVSLCKGDTHVKSCYSTCLYSSYTSSSTVNTYDMEMALGSGKVVIPVKAAKTGYLLVKCYYRKNLTQSEPDCKIYKDSACTQSVSNHMVKEGTTYYIRLKQSDCSKKSTCQLKTYMYPDEPKNTYSWEQISCDSDDVKIGNYEYWFEHVSTGDGSLGTEYRVYKRHCYTGTTTSVSKFDTHKYGSSDFYTNGRYLVYGCRVASTGASMVKCKDMVSGTTKTIVNLDKYTTSSSYDTILEYHFDKNYMYYSKYRGLSKIIYSTYRVDLTTGESKTISSSYKLNCFYDFRCTGKYVTMTNSDGSTVIYDVRGCKSLKTLGKNIRAQATDGKYLYYLYCEKPYASEPTYKVRRTLLDGTGTVKTLATFTCKYNIDRLYCMTDKSITFYDNSAVPCRRYTYSTQTWKTLTDTHNHHRCYI